MCLASQSCTLGAGLVQYGHGAGMQLCACPAYARDMPLFECKTLMPNVLHSCALQQRATAAASAAAGHLQTL
jgi:hypothetical protein